MGFTRTVTNQISFAELASNPEQAKLLPTGSGTVTVTRELGTSTSNHLQRQVLQMQYVERLSFQDLLKAIDYLKDQGLPKNFTFLTKIAVVEKANQNGWRPDLKISTQGNTDWYSDHQLEGAS